MERVWSALPDARDAEIQRLTERVASAADGLRERDAEIELHKNNIKKLVEIAVEKDHQIQRLQRSCASAEAWIADSGTASDGATDILRELRAALNTEEKELWTS